MNNEKNDPGGALLPGLFINYIMLVLTAEY